MPELTLDLPTLPVPLAPTATGAGGSMLAGIWSGIHKLAGPRGLPINTDWDTFFCPETTLVQGDYALRSFGDDILLARREQELVHLYPYPLDAIHHTAAALQSLLTATADRPWTIGGQAGVPYWGTIEPARTWAYPLYPLIHALALHHDVLLPYFLEPSVFLSPTSITPVRLKFVTMDTHFEEAEAAISDRLNAYIAAKRLSLACVGQLYKPYGRAVNQSLVSAFVQQHSIPVLSAHARLEHLHTWKEWL